MDPKNKKNLIHELKFYASKIFFQKEYDGKFIMHAFIDTHHVIFCNEVGGIVKAWIPY